MQRINPELNPSRFQKITKELNRAQTSLLNQLHSSHIPTNSYLFRIHKADSPRCSSCGNMRETVFHLLHECPTYRAERHTAFASLGWDARSTSFLLATKTGIARTMEYIKSTKCFAAKPQDNAS
jgi:zinc-binding in reverse transcriptase